MAENSFWKLLKDLGAEHDRQLTGLITLVRELRLELNAATSVDRDIISLRSENMELKRQLALTMRQPPKQMPCIAEGGARRDTADSQPVNASSMSFPLDSDKQNPIVAEPICQFKVGEESKDEPLPFAGIPYIGHLLRSLSLTRKSSLRVSITAESAVQRPLAFIDTGWFEALIGVFILINTLCMMLEAQYLGLRNGYITQFPGMKPTEDDWPGADDTFFVIDRMFTIIFAIELMLRFMRYRFQLFKNPLNWIDVLSVLASFVQWVAEDVSLNPTIVRLLRVARLIRGVRFLKSKKVQGCLNILMKCMQASITTLFWSLCLLIMVQCIVGMVVGQVAQDFIVDLSNPEAHRHEVYRYYGTFTKTFITMFEVHMANWATPARVMIDNVGELYGNLFVLYRCVLGFALMNVIGAVFVQQAMAVQQQDQDLMILKKQKEAESYNIKLRALFDSLDKDGDGTLSREEFDAVTNDDGLKAWMEALDINPDDLQGLFDLLDTGDGSVSADEFLMGATRVRGTARNIDVAQLMVTAQRLERMIEKTQTQLAKLEVLEEHILAQNSLHSKDKAPSSGWAITLPTQLLPETGLARH